MSEFRRLARAGIAAAIMMIVAAMPAMADDDKDFIASYNDFGNTGLLQMPNARMAPDGDFALGASYVWPYTRYFVTSQFLPWLQGTLRYTDISNQDYGFNNGQSYKDKGVDAKIRLLAEGEDHPEISVGLRDIGGTGLFASEYIAMSRRIYDFDFTLGVAWGNAGTRGDIRNPFGLLIPRMKTRGAAQGTGSLTGDYFTGERASIIAGIEYHTPIEGLKLKLELDGNSYQEEPKLNKFDTASRLNFGIEYEATDWLDLNASFERGNKAMLRFVLHSNLNSDKGIPKLDDRRPMAVKPRQASISATSAPDREIGRKLARSLTDFGLEGESIDVRGDTTTIRLRQIPAADTLTDFTRSYDQIPGRPARLRLLDSEGRPLNDSFPHTEAETTAEGKAIFDDLLPYDIVGKRYFVEGQTATLVFSQSAYIRTAMAFGRAARVVANHVPPWVEAVHMVLMNEDIAVEEVTMLRRDVENASLGLGSADEAWSNTIVTAPAEPEERDGEYASDRGVPYSFTVMPHLRESLGGPDAFLLYQLYAQPILTVSPLPGLELAGSAGINLINNFEKFSYQAPSNMPRVRTRVKDYMKGGDVWMDSLYANYQRSLAPAWYAAVAGGVFEQMYGGIGGEVLYRPPAKRWALGLELNHVWQRAPGEAFGFEDYNITTGHLSYYQMTPYDNVYFILSAGRYLAGDVGATLRVGRRFDNGVEFGVWATKTNVSAAEFGEGAFDKGLFISIPMDLFYTKHSRNRAYFPFSPLIRDGGQKVGQPTGLFSRTGSFDPMATRGGWRNTWE